jgi:hypothetical protein
VYSGKKEAQQKRVEKILSEIPFDFIAYLLSYRKNIIKRPVSV